MIIIVVATTETETSMLHLVEAIFPLCMAIVMVSEFMQR